MVSALVGPLPLVPLTGPLAAPASALSCGTAVDATDGAPALHAAVAAAATADPGCPEWSVALTGTFDLTDALVHAAVVPLRLVGPEGSRATLRSDGTDRIVTLRRPGRTLELIRVELRGGDATGTDLDGIGGGVGAEAAPLADPTPSRVRVEDALLVDGTASAGGAIAADEVTLIDVDLVANTAARGGAVDVGTLVAVRTQFIGNAATLAPGQGGAVRAGGDVTLTTVTFAGNAAATGGSVWVSGLADPVLRATATTFADARADAGGHVAGDVVGGGSVRLVLRATVLAGITALTPGGPVPAVCAGVVGPGVSSDSDAPVHALATDASCPGADAAVVAPVLTPLAGPVGVVEGRSRLFLPAAGGPLVDVADCAGVWPAADARGVTRPQPVGGRCDVGAVEREPDASPTLSPGGSGAGDADSGDTDAGPRPAGVPAGWGVGRGPGSAWRLLRRR